MFLLSFNIFLLAKRKAMVLQQFFEREILQQCS